MSRSEADLLSDIADAITAIRSHLTHGPLSAALVMDAVAMRLLEIGEAVKSLDGALKSTEPEIKWRQIAGMRDLLAHHYFATQPEIVQSTVDKDLEPLEAAVGRMLDRIAPTLTDDGADGG